MAKTIITAHSGCEGTAPNSMDHIRTALACGAEMLEIDIRRGDGILYLSHDLGDPHTAVSFRTFLKELKTSPAVRVNCDVKTDGLAEAVLTEAAEAGLTDRIVFTGSCMGEESLIGRMGGEFWYSIWDMRDFEPAVASMAKTGARVLNMPHGFATEETKRAADKYSIVFSCWTPDGEEEIRRLLDLGVYNITTRRPVRALGVRASVLGE